MKGLEPGPMDSIFSNDFQRISQGIPDLTSLFGTHWLITGSTGMIGSYLASFLGWLNEQRLGEPVRMTATTRRPIDTEHPNVGHLAGKEYMEFTRVDFAGEFSVPWKESIDIVFHGASNAAPKAYLNDPIGTINSNVKATQLLLDQAVRSSRLRRFLFVSSGEIYGDPDMEHIPTPEDYRGTTNHLAPRSCYVEAKRFAETLCWNYFHHHRVPVRMIRPVHVYGPGFGEDDGRVWADFIARAARGKDIEILSDGKARRGFCYLADALSQILAVLQRGHAGEVYNVGNDRHVSILDLANTVSQVSGGAVRVVIKNQIPDYLKGSPQISCPSIEKVKALGPLLTTPLNEGIAKSFNWFRKRMELQE